MEADKVTKRDRQRLRRQEKEEAILEQIAKRKKRRNAYVIGIAVVALLAVGITFWLLQMGEGEEEVVPTTTTESSTVPITCSAPITTTNGENEMPNYTPYTPEQYGQGAPPPAEVPNPSVLGFSDAPALSIDLTKQYEAVFNTSEGVIRVQLDAVNTPGTTNNFITLTRYGYYNGSQLFRTDPSIGIIQGGGPTANSPADPGPGYTICDEGTGFKYVAGQLVMARTGAPNSAGAQFFFAVDERTSLLDGQGVYVVFGQTTEGLDILENILGLHQDDPTSGLGGGPSRDVVVESIEIIETS